jgi:hypothetical protein
LSWRWHDDFPVLKGDYHFGTEYRGISFQDTFNLEFNFPPDYPENLPVVKEIDNKIPNLFHRFTDGSLCLCTTAEQYLIFSKQPTLENYIKNLVNPYLLSWLWYQRFNEMPWGERSHGGRGLLESYQELLQISDQQCVIIFMVKFVKNEIYQKQECPCGSGLPFKKCHRNILFQLQNYLPKGQMILDFIKIIGGLKI